MHPVLARSFGGLPPRYYVRQLLFGLFFPVFLLLASTHGKGLLALPVHLQVILALDTLLYPYSRFVYESVVGYIVGDNAFIFPVILFGAMVTAVVTTGTIALERADETPLTYVDMPFSIVPPTAAKRPLIGHLLPRTRQRHAQDLIVEI
jgi:hypothetical protein